MARKLARRAPRSRARRHTLPQEVFDRSLVVYKQDGQVRCIEVPDAAAGARDDLASVPGAACHQIYQDSDGLLW